MVIRELIFCLTCKTPITTRIWVGHNNYQAHAFLCPNCSEEITIGLEVNFEDLSTTVKHIENCEHGDIEGQVFNLSPHFVYDESHENSDLSFPWMEQAIYIRKAGGSDWPEHKREKNGPLLLDIYGELGGIYLATEMWKTIKKGWSLTNNNQEQLAQKILSEYKKYGYEDEIKLKNILFDFSGRLLAPAKISLFNSAVEVAKFAKQTNEKEFLRFKEYYLTELRKEHMERYFDILSEYFKAYSEYDQTILYVKNLVEVPAGCIATSAGYKSTKMFYGNAFEHYTSNLTFLACINNIAMGRNFDEFEQMSLKKYVTINKANRINPILRNKNLVDFGKCLDSTLRNASHHGASKLINHRRVLEYRSGGTGEKKEMPYSKYLENCSNIALSATALMMIEILLSI